MDTRRSLTFFFGKGLVERIPSEALKKIQTFCDSYTKKLANEKAAHNETQKKKEKLGKEFERLNTKHQEVSVKNDAAQLNVAELNNQLQTALAENAGLTKQVAKLEGDIDQYRNERNQVIDERDQLLQMSHEKASTINGLQSDVKSLENRLHSAIGEKCDAITQFTNVIAKEQNFEEKENRMKKEIERLESVIFTLTDNFNKTSSELVALKHENRSVTARMETALEQKIVELRAANATIVQLEESKQNDSESVNIKGQFIDSDILIRRYKQELDGKVKLAELYKASLNECQSQTAELTAESTKLQGLLQQTTEKCESLETKLKSLDEQHQIELNQNLETIAKLMDEVKVANGLLETSEKENAEKVLEKMFPRAAAANRLLQKNSSLTDIYSRYYNTLNGVHRLEAECLQLNTNLERLTIRLQDTTSEFERQRVEYEATLKVNEEMKGQINGLVAEQENLREKLHETMLRSANLEGENTQMKGVQNDLARQICNLLNKKETSGNELTPDQQQFRRMGLNISKPLVTFDNIVELQENNQNLLLKVRELSGKVERLEDVNIGMKCYEEKMGYLERRLFDTEQSRQAKKDLLAMILKQKERFKELYFDAMKYLDKEPVTEELDSSATSDQQSLQSSDEKFVEIKEKLKERLKEMKNLSKEYTEYREDMTINFNLLKEEYDTMQRKVDELSTKNSQIQSQAKYANERLKSQEADVVIYKTQIQILEDRNRMYDNIIAKHETANKTLRDEALNSMLKISAAENRSEYLEQECRRLVGVNINLETENKAFHRQKIAEKIVQCNLELMKISSERARFEGRTQIEIQSGEYVRQYEAVSKKFEEEKRRLRDELESLKQQKESAIKKLIDEQTQTNDLRKKLSEVRELAELKNVENKNLSKKLHDALTPTTLDNAMSRGHKRIKDLEASNKELELVLLERKEELHSLIQEKRDLDETLKVLRADLAVSHGNETNLKNHIEELQKEIRIQLANSLSKDAAAEYENKLKTELMKAVEEITEYKKESQELRAECLKLKENLKLVEAKYANETLAHSSDLQRLKSRQDELNKCNELLHESGLAKTEAVELLKLCQSEWATANKEMNENRQQLEEKVENLEKQNVELLDLMQAQNSKAVASGGDVFNDSFSSINVQTMTEEQFKEFSSRKLFNVVKYFKREKDIVVTKMESLKLENTRQMTELDMQNKRINELNLQLTVIKSPDHSYDLESTTKDEDLKHNVEALAVADSNICLRAENQNLEEKVKDLTEKVVRLEGELLPLMEKNRELTEEYKEKDKENRMLQGNVAQHKRMLKQVNDELNSIKNEKDHLQEELAAKTQLLQATIDDQLKLKEEISNNKEANERSEIRKKEEEIRAIQSKLFTTDAQLKDAVTKEIQIRKIAKKYKDLYIDVNTKQLLALKEEIKKLKEKNGNFQREDHVQVYTLTNRESEPDMFEESWNEPESALKFQSSSQPSTSAGCIGKGLSDLVTVKGTSSQSVKQATPINLRRSASTPFFGMRTMSFSNSSNIVGDISESLSGHLTSPSVVSQQRIQKRPRDSNGCSPRVVECSFASDKMLPPRKRSRIGEEQFEKLTESRQEETLDKKDVNEGMEEAADDGHKTGETDNLNSQGLVIDEDDHRNDNAKVDVQNQLNAIETVVGIPSTEPQNYETPTPTSYAKRDGSDGNWLNETSVGDRRSSSHQVNQSEINFETVDELVKEPEEPMAGPSSQAQLIEYQFTVAKIEPKTGETASTTHIVEDENQKVEIVQETLPVGAKGPLSDGNQEHHAAEVSISLPITCSELPLPRVARMIDENQRINRITWHRVGRCHQIAEDNNEHSDQTTPACAKVTRGQGRQRRSHH